MQRFYSIELTEAREGAEEKKWSLRWTRRDQAYEEDAQLLGCYVLRTNRENFTGAELWRLYMTLTRGRRRLQSAQERLGPQAQRPPHRTAR